MLWNIPYIAVVALIVLGLYACMFKSNLVKIIIGTSLLEAGANLFLITLGYRKGGIAPIFTNAPSTESMVLPVPQALVLTSIVIGLAVTALLLSIAVMIYRHYGTIDAKKVRRLRG
ncbi:MAG: cation:proton antiporter subunit C [Deltaproteobacteria bacterium]|nr:cation:proton antiporter subunit C [Deltaproteobacteria bacterium]